ncbi:hypothetical protein [Azoarcus sp. KH32C]|uniref:hypothetical protein n=1 Tax=Azoarcus sp. KH32C TaxID=748247 RepID=UPI0012EA1B00|nr:hypothetical protein [Azoarcus sp. KH32C]
MDELKRRETKSAVPAKDFVSLRANSRPLLFFDADLLGRIFRRMPITFKRNKLRRS